ncbi:MAG: rhomboid family intramembrane serine protease [Pseudomonadota bacterium]
MSDDRPEEDEGPPRGRPGVPLPVLLLVLGIGAIELALSAADEGFFGPDYLRLQVYAYGAFWGELLATREPIFAAQPVTMFVTHAFLHGGMVHMLLNMVVTLSVGKLVAESAGSARMILAFLICAVAGAGAFALIGPTAAVLVGASGAVFGLFGIWKCWEYRWRRARGLSLRPVWSFIIVLALINVPLFIALSGALAWEAHLGGFAAGWLIAPAIARRPYPG